MLEAAWRVVKTWCLDYTGSLLDCPKVFSPGAGCTCSPSYTGAGRTCSPPNTKGAVHVCQTR
jgi:hypothetical protein